ncbi:hypothetical protein GH714_024851 [Hevea brasiliensis]|uniref:Ubiquitin carboxyl-terminal hydrolase n=1 Tax=Hevea brasiliensis TaxID=3981 RepID=A0A6A6MPS4_HEVBR|nr:hypothetical protein GH714_024851 [Hevea brasiliensis]
MDAGGWSGCVYWRGFRERLLGEKIVGKSEKTNSERVVFVLCVYIRSGKRSEGGLFVDMNTFLAFGKDCVRWNYEKTGNSVYLLIKQTKKLVPEDRPSKKPTLLAIGVDGGFDNNEPKYEETHSIVILTDYVTFPFPSVELPEKVRLAVDAILMAEGAERKEQLAAWTTDKNQISAYAMNLQQIDNDVEIGISVVAITIIEHYKETSYPLAVKLGTITADLEAAGSLTRISTLIGTEFKKVERKWNQFFGPGYTGLVNLGNSCYMAATMQFVFSTRSFYSRYYMNQSLKTAFEMAPADPTVDFNSSLNYPVVLVRNKVICINHVNPYTLCFQMAEAGWHMKDDNANAATSTNSDALEFFLHFLDQVERVNGGKPTMDPSRSFKFGIEERILCPSGKVTYNRRLDYILSLNISLHEANIKSSEFLLSIFTSNRSSEEIVCPRTAGLTSFPDYLVLHMRKFLMEEGWVPKKLDVYIDVPDIIDINHMRSRGLQPGEELLPDGGIVYDVRYGGDIEKATDWIFNDADASVSSDMDAATSSITPTLDDTGLPEEGRYRLFGIVSHIGTSTQCGHYVVHVLKDGRWVIFKDNKVGASVNPPKDMGYSYFFERFDS